MNTIGKSDYTTPAGTPLQLGDLVQHVQTFKVYYVNELTAMSAKVFNRNTGEHEFIESPAVVCEDVETGDLTKLWVKKVEHISHEEAFAQDDFETATDEENAAAWAEYVAALGL